MDSHFLGSEAWKRLDAEVCGANGELHEVREKMELVLQSDEITELCDRLGILVTSFAFRDVLTKETRFYRSNVEPVTYRTKYIWSNSSFGVEEGNFVHELFVAGRTIQAKREKDSASKETSEGFVPDFLAHIPLVDNQTDTRGKFEFESQFRQTYRSHYCSVGEMVAFTVAWRMLCTARDMGQGDALAGC